MQGLIVAMHQCNKVQSLGSLVWLPYIESQTLNLSIRSNLVESADNPAMKQYEDQSVKQQDSTAAILNMYLVYNWY